MICLAAASGASAGSDAASPCGLAAGCPLLLALLRSRTVVFGGCALLYLALAGFGFGLSRRRIGRLLLGDGRLIGRLAAGRRQAPARPRPLAAKKRAETDDRALLQRVLVDLAVLDDPAGDAAAGTRRARLPLSATRPP